MITGAEVICCFGTEFMSNHDSFAKGLRPCIAAMGIEHGLSFLRITRHYTGCEAAGAQIWGNGSENVSLSGADNHNHLSVVDDTNVVERAIQESEMQRRE